MNPMQYAVYKGTGGKFGAVQFNFQRPHFYSGKQKDFTGASCFEEVDGRRRLKEGWKEREGCVFLEIAPTVDKNTYDWNQKIIMALSVGDLSKVLYFLVTGKSPVKKERERDGKPTNSMTLMHDPGAKSDREGQVRKYLRLYSPGGTADGLMLSAEHVTGDEKRSHSVPLTGDEVIALRSLLQVVIPAALSW